MTPTYTELQPGDPAPWFHQRSFANPRYAFDSAAGRYIVMCFYGSAAEQGVKSILDEIQCHRNLLNDATASFFGISVDPADEAEQRVSDSYPGFRYFWDFDGTVSRLYGALPHQLSDDQKLSQFRRMWIVLDPTLRVIRRFSFSSDGPAGLEVVSFLASLPEPSSFAGFEVHAPILVLPNVFEPELCEQLIGLYDSHGGEASGFMRDIAGKTVLVTDHKHKNRRDCTLDDAEVISTVQARFKRRVFPEIAKVYQFKVTRMERYLVGCYAAEDDAHFRAHRDNTTKGTAHRRFAASINLNSNFDGGEISFPEYGKARLKPPPGGAVVFSCSLLHAVSKVTRGRRYAFLPFLYDDAAAAIREANHSSLGNVSGYKVANPT